MTSVGCQLGPGGKTTWVDTDSKNSSNEQGASGSKDNSGQNGKVATKEVGVVEKVTTAIGNGLTTANDFITSDPVVNFSQGLGGSLSFGITDKVNTLLGSPPDTESDSYKNGEKAGLVVGLAQGAAHLGRHALNVGAKKFFSDTRKYATVQKKWSQSVGGYKGKYELHHWYTPQSYGGTSAGWNLVPVTPMFNNAMGNGGLLFNTFKWSYMGTNAAAVSGIVNALPVQSEQK